MIDVCIESDLVYKNGNTKNYLIYPELKESFYNFCCRYTFK